jgi:hypothetical protein
MATGKTGGMAGSGTGATTGAGRRWKGWALALLALAGFGLWYQGEAIGGQAQAATAYGARTACSCRHLGGRELGSCQDDFVPGMWAVILTEDTAEKSVTATVPLVSSETARFRDGFGCVLDTWEG